MAEQTESFVVTPRWLLENYSFDGLGIDPDTVPARLKDWDPVDCGDTLFLFLVRELSDCAEDAEECLRRVYRAMDDLESVAWKLADMIEEKQNERR